VVKDIDHERFIVRVKPCTREAEIPDWSSGGAPTTFEVARHVYDILLGDFDRGLLSWLDPGSRARVQSCMEMASAEGLDHGMIPVRIGKRIEINTFAGERVNALISDVFRLEHGVYDISNSALTSSFSARLDYHDIESTLRDIPAIISEEDFPLRLEDNLDRFVKNKFIEHLPGDVAAHMRYSLLYRPDELLRLLRDNGPVQVHDFKL